MFIANRFILNKEEYLAFLMSSTDLSREEAIEFYNKHYTKQYGMHPDEHAKQLEEQFRTLFDSNNFFDKPYGKKYTT